MRQPRTRGPKAKFAPPSLRDIMSREELIKAHQAAELHDRHLQNAMIAARQRNNAMGMASPGDIPYGGPSNRRSPVRLTSGLSRSARHDEGLEGV